MADDKYGVYRGRDEEGNLKVERYDANGKDMDAQQEDTSTTSSTTTTSKSTKQSKTESDES